MATALTSLLLVTFVFTFLSCIPGLLGSRCGRRRPCVTSQDFDFVVVGAGTTGSVIINRLSELPNIKVLAIEAGGVPTEVSTMPLVCFKAMGSEMDWNYTTVPQKTAGLSFNDQKIPIARGKALGGTSSINFMTYTRGNKRDYDTWRDYGNDGWGFDDLKKYFMNIEGYNVLMTRDEAPYHNVSGGPLRIEDPVYKSLMAEAFRQSCREIGQPLVDYNGKYQMGCMYPPVTTSNGERWGAYKAYLLPAMKRSNVKVVAQALVTKILIDDNKVAVGVRYEKDGKVCEVKVKREVILSGGTMNSPQLLMLSGVGPKDHLDSMKIKVVQDLPGVGQNFQDHVTIGGLTYTIDQKVTMNSVRLETPEYEQLWRDTKTGPITVPVSFEGLLFYKTNVTSGPDDWPDLEMFFNSDNTARIFKPFITAAASANIPEDSVDCISFHPILLRPKSRGEVKLNSSDPHDAPLIDPKYLSHPDDLEIMAEGITLSQQMGATHAFTQYGAKIIGGGQFSTCLPKFSQGIQEYKKCFAQHLSSTGYHPSGTCKMGPASDNSAVVDKDLKVHGIKNLRVADASIMPNIVAGHPQVACFVIGEKVSDAIKADIRTP